MGERKLPCEVERDRERVVAWTEGTVLAAAQGVRVEAKDWGVYL